MPQQLLPDEDQIHAQAERHKLGLWLTWVAITLYPAIAVVCFIGPNPREGMYALGCVALLMVVAIGYWRVNR